MVIVAGCVLERNGKYLLVQEKRQHVYGLWNLPAGHVDEGETIEAAAVREVKEETGFDVELREKIYAEAATQNSPALHAFKAVIVGGELAFDPDELLDVRWFGLDEIRQLQKDGKMRNSWAVRAIRQVT